MNQWLNSIPLVYAKVAAMSLFLMIVVISWMLPGEFIFSGAPDRKKWRDLRVWGTVIVLLQFIIYALF